MVSTLYQSYHIPHIIQEDTKHNNIEDEPAQQQDDDAEEEHESDQANNTNDNADNTDDEGTHAKHDDSSGNPHCVPVEMYNTLLEENAALKKENEKLKLDIECDTAITDLTKQIRALNKKCTDLQHEKSEMEKILMNQEKHVDKLNKKITKLEMTVNKRKCDLLTKEQEITELMSTIDELNRKISNLKRNYKDKEHKEFTSLNNQILSLKNEIEVRDFKINLQIQKHKALQDRYLQLMSKKRITPHEELLNKAKEMRNAKLINNKLQQQHVSVSSVVKMEKVKLPSIKGTVNTLGNSSSIKGDTGTGKNFGDISQVTPVVINDNNKSGDDDDDDDDIDNSVDNVEQEQ